LPHAQLSAFARFDLPIHAYGPGLYQRMRLAATACDAHGFQQLIQPDDLTFHRKFRHTLPLRRVGPKILFMNVPEMSAIDAAIARATEIGALHAIATEQAFIEDSGIRFLVRWAASLSAKNAAREPERPGAPPKSPFLPPEPALTLGPAGPEHLIVLNKYPVIARHLLIVTRQYAEQTLPPDRTDFSALASLMRALGGLGFYNGGEPAGASQRHKHLQWIPESPQSDCLRSMTAALPVEGAPLEVVTHPRINWRHAFVRLQGAASGNLLFEAFTRAAAACDLRAHNHHLPPYNFLANETWMLVVPRSREHAEGISINALGFAGSMFVPHPRDIDIVRRTGPLAMLATVATHAATNRLRR